MHGSYHEQCICTSAERIDAGRYLKSTAYDGVIIRGVPSVWLLSEIESKLMGQLCF